jgi:hypothetical protein
MLRADGENPAYVADLEDDVAAITETATLRAQLGGPQVG